MPHLYEPILLIVWRRPQTLRKVINALRPIAPMHLYVACDGPRPDYPDESAKVAATREVIEQEIDWPCRIQRLYSDSNQGCSVGPIRAITWFFDQVEEGIILEDDCIPHPDFFSYCTSLLERHRSDLRVWCISGNCFLSSQLIQSVSQSGYYFSRYTLTWGWASWSDRWRHYDSKLKQWPSLRDSGLLQQIFEDPYEAMYWAEIFDRTYRQREVVTWWDYQWFFSALIRGALTATPVSNLVSNVGFGEGATHTLNPATTIHPALPLGSLSHPDFVVRHREADIYTYAHHFGGIRRRRLRTFQQRINRRFNRALAWMGLR